MHRVAEMLQTNPSGSVVDAGTLNEVIEAVESCGETCEMCADACLGEQQVDNLRRCIRLNLDCSDVCEATAGVLGRQTQADLELWRTVLQACATACRVCAEECERHASMHEHCRVCAESCRECEEACNRLLSAVAA